MNDFSISRRSFLTSACCLAASPLVTPMSFAAMPGDNRFVTIVLRGALDGLHLVQPYADPLFKTLRPTLALDPSNGLLDLDGRFGLHPAAADLFPLWKSGELAFVQAVSTPYRDKRSHFDGQDLLESGGENVGDSGSGWMNRALGAIPRSRGKKAIDVSTSAELILSGPNPVDVWSTESNLEMQADELAFFHRLYKEDEAFERVFNEAVKTDGDSDALLGNANRRTTPEGMARLTAGMLNGDYRLASFSIGGWDTHVGQAYQFKKPIGSLTKALMTLKAELGPETWSKTAVLAMTEFGRTVRENGSKGTDHGTGGMAILAGGAIKGGKIYGKWPGLKDSQLYENRDLMPTGDVREIAAALLNSQFDIGASALTTQVFPGLDLDLKAQNYLRA